MKTYQCPFCNIKLNKDKLVKHIEHKHETEVKVNYPGFTPYRLVYDIVNNHPEHCGWCCICSSKTGWNNKTNKYFRICKNPECAKKIREQYEKRMMRVYNKTTLLNDPEHQEKMLAGRRISGKYTWSDGKVFTYTGSYEKQLLEFLDKVMNYDSKDIIMPGPILEYDHNGVKRKWITDCYIPSLQLIIEVKDGKNNPNKKNMSVTREKTICKEKMITNQGVYNYLRLTDNDFGQLLAILAEMKMKMIDEDDSKTFRIHEETELNDKDQYQEQDVIDHKCMTIYQTINVKFADLVEVVNGESYLEDGFTDSEVYMACYIHPKMINADYESTFKRIITKINNHLKKTYPKENIVGFWIDEVEPLRGYGIGIEMETL